MVGGAGKNPAPPLGATRLITLTCRAFPSMRQDLSDPSILWLGIWRAWSFGASPLTALIVVHSFSAEGQGLFYGFSGLAGMVVWFELGIGGLLVQSVAYASPSVARMSPETSEVPLLAVFDWWFSLAASAFFVAVSVFGLFWFSGAVSGWLWRFDWLLFAFGSALCFWQNRRILALEGSGEIAESYRIRLIGTVLSSLVAWGTMLAGVGLAALGLAQVVQFGVRHILCNRYRGGTWAPSSRQHTFRELFGAWCRRVAPLQWRTAIAVFCGYLVYQSASLVALRLLGSAVAGQLGLSLMLGNVVTAVSLIPISASAALMSQSAATPNLVEVRRLMRRAGERGFIFGGLAAISMLVALRMAIRIGVLPADKLLPMGAFWPILLCSLAALTTQLCIITARSFRRDPFVVLNVGAALLWLGLLKPLIAHFGIGGILWGMAAVQGGILAAGHIVLALRLWRTLHG